jgi:hypothetical protein
MRAAIFVCLFPIVLFAQDYFEASGRTEVFTLKAGAKAPPVAIKTARMLQHQTTFRFTVAGNVLNVNPARNGVLKLYTLDGRVLEVHLVNSSGIVNLKRPPGNGIYLLRFEPEGLPVKTAKLVITERGTR